MRAAVRGSCEAGQPPGSIEGSSRQMRRFIWLPVIGLALIIVWMMITIPTNGDYWDIVYPEGAKQG